MNYTKDENHRKRAAIDMLSIRLKARIRQRGWTGNRKHDSMAAYVYRLAKSKNASAGEGAISNWIHGCSLPRFSTLLALAQWLGCEPEDLLERRLWDVLKGFDDGQA